MRLLQPIDALRGALIDPARRERSVLLALAAYLALWTIYGTIAKSSQGLHPDMTELVAWSRDLAWGYKHPPLAALIVRLWFSLFLLAGLAVAALIDKRRAGYFRSAAPWITVLAGLAVLAPHLVWLAQNDFAPFSYAVTLHGDKPFAVTVFAALGYLAGSIGYVAIPVIIVLAAARPNRATIADMVWPGDSERRLAAAAFWAPLLLPAAGALASGTEITPLWSMPAWTLLPVLLLSSPKLTMATADTRGILVAAVAVPLIVLIAATR